MQINVETITGVGYLVVLVLSIIVNATLIMINIAQRNKKRKEAKTIEEKNEADEIMKTNIKAALENIRYNLDKEKLEYSIKAIKKIFKKEIKQ